MAVQLPDLHQLVLDVPQTVMDYQILYPKRFKRYFYLGKSCTMIKTYRRLYVRGDFR